MFRLLAILAGLFNRRGDSGFGFDSGRLNFVNLPLNPRNSRRCERESGTARQLRGSFFIDKGRMMDDEAQMVGRGCDPFHRARDAPDGSGSNPGAGHGGVQLSELKLSAGRLWRASAKPRLSLSARLLRPDRV